MIINAFPFYALPYGGYIMRRQPTQEQYYVTLVHLNSDTPVEQSITNIEVLPNAHHFVRLWLLLALPVASWQATSLGNFLLIEPP